MKRFIFWLGFTLAVGLSGFWFIGSQTIKQQTQSWFQNQRAQGWAARAHSIKVRGFPYRFDTTLTDIHIKDPYNSIGWDAPFLQLFTLAYQPTSIIAVWPNTQTIHTQTGPIDIKSQDMRASLNLASNASLRFQKLIFDVKHLHLARQNDWEIHLDQARFAARNTQKNTYDIFLELNTARIDPSIKSSIDPKNQLSEILKTIRVDMQTSLDRPLDRFTFSENSPHINTITIRDMTLIWGDIKVQASAALNVDYAGWPTGTITLNITNWNDIIELSEQSGIIDERIAAFLESFFEKTAVENNINLPLTVRNKQIYLGFAPLGPAPNFWQY